MFLGLGAIFVVRVVWGILFICASSDGLHIVSLLVPFLCFTCYHLTTCIFSGCSQYIGALSGGIPKFTRVAWGAFVPVGYAPPCPSFQPWENRAWWWSRFKEPPSYFILLVSWPPFMYSICKIINSVSLSKCHFLQVPSHHSQQLKISHCSTSISQYLRDIRTSFLLRINCAFQSHRNSYC